MDDVERIEDSRTEKKVLHWIPDEKRNVVDDTTLYLEGYGLERY